MKKLKLKKGAKIILIIIVVIVILILGTCFGIKKYNEYKYKQTNEYKLTVVGYTLDESKKIINKLNDENELYFVNNPKNEYIIKLLDETYFMEKNLSEYLDYIEENNSKSLQDVVAIVNVHANKDWYDEKTVKSTDLSKEEKILVNKFNYLDKSYVPKDIVNIDLSYAYSDNSATKITNDAYINMAVAAKKEGIQLLVNSSYRDCESQQEAYDDYYYGGGTEYADKYAARPGYSEHQTGLALDIFTYNSTTSNFDKTDAFNWLVNNSYKYGFILRYPKGKEYLTGYNYESWHYRYVGVETATKVHELGITYDEYYAFFIE